MRISCLAAIILTALPVRAFLPVSLKSSPTAASFAGSTKLNMVFDTTKGQNMFDGPTPLVKERDACGVGFIANTKSGGKQQ